MSLPLLRYTSNLYPAADFSNTAIIACQHLLGTTLDLFKELFAKGLRPESVFLLGKCYSTHSGTLKKFQKLGVHVSPLSIAFDAGRSYDDQFEDYVANLVDEAASALELKNFARILILDDGGFVIRRVNESFKDVANVVGIEQTSSGHEKLKTIELRFPVINVARSKAKLEIESPLIAKRVIEKLSEKMGFSMDTRVLVIGQGSVGKEIKQQLQGRCTVNGCDSQADRCDFQGNYSDQLPTFDVIIGATGQLAVTVEECKKLKQGAVLVSASSSDREFPALALRANTRSKKCHADSEIAGVRFLNGGFPINFDGGLHSLPPNEAQLTRSLLLAGLCEAVIGDHAAGLSDLSEQQNMIVQEFTKYVR